MNMGIAPFNIASSVILITAQRLARKLCTCKKPHEIPEEALKRAGFTDEQIDEKGTWQAFSPVGCELCKNTGYKGRLGIYQVMPISEEMSRIVMKNGTAIDLADQAQREGIKDLRQSGLIKVMKGLTSLEEVEAVTNE
jgi:type IV pilus assembly protein PilB